MKIKNLMIGMAACAALTACTSDGGDDPGPDPNAGTGKSYVSFRIVSANGGGRAEDGDYQDGEGAENSVSNAHFYFYDKDDRFVTIGTTISSATPQDPASGKDEDGNIEKVCAIGVVLENETGLAPAKVLVVLNMPASVTDDQFVNKDLSEAMEQLTQSFRVNDAADAGFTMTNSTYVANNKIECATAVTEYDGSGNVISTKLKDSSAKATADPVTIYVERLAAKVSLKEGVNLADKSTVTRPMGPDGTPTTFKIEVLGWTLSGTNKEGYFMKNLDAGWINNMPWNGWNSETHPRSFWSKDPNYNLPTDAVDQGKYNEIIKDDGTVNDDAYLNAKSLNDIDPTNNKGASLDGSEYCFENTLDAAFYGTTSAVPWQKAATYVLVKAQMKVSTATDPVSLYRYKGVLYTLGDEPDLKGGYLSAAMTDLAKNIQFFTGDGENKRAINEKDVTTAPDGTEGKAKLVLTEANKDVTWSDKTGNTYNVDAVNRKLAELNSADTFKDGLMYYMIPIEHLNATANAVGSYGVVRNHFYVLTLNKIESIGHAVYDPSIPLGPTDNPETYYLAATLNILSWHIVNQNVDL